MSCTDCHVVDNVNGACTFGIVIVQTTTAIMITTKRFYSVEKV